MSNPRQAAEGFQFPDRILDVRPFGHGLINDTFLVITEGGEDGWAVLQRINQRVFPDPALIMENLRVLLDHVRAAGDAADGFRLPAIVSSKTGADFHEDAAGGFWRALSFIRQTRCFDTLDDTAQAAEVGRMLGRFHALVADLDPHRLHDTLPGFHITPRYLDRFERIINRHAPRATPELRFCLNFVAARKSQAGVLEDAKQRGLLAVRPIHGDPKLNNILFHEQTQRAVSLVDLDTVKPGLVHYDLGDCLRSCCNRTGENPDAAGNVTFDQDIAQAILQSYFRETRGFLTGHDHAYLYDAIRLIPFELGLRFLTDYLEGNRYFKVSLPEQNLQRAVLQFQLTENIERNERPIRQLLDDR